MTVKESEMVVQTSQNDSSASEQQINIYELDIVNNIS